jgi:competence protein ComEC
MQFVKKWWREIVLGLLVFANLSVWFLLYQHRQTNLLYIYYLPVGQGDSILIDSPTHAHILIDGGPDATVLSKLGQILPFGDRNIDVMVEANPSASSITGLVDVLKQYKVGVFLAPSMSQTSYTQTVLNQQIQNLNIRKVLAQRGTTVDVGSGAQLQFVFSKQAVAQIVYGTQTIPLTSTSTKNLIEIETDGETQPTK